MERIAFTSTITMGMGESYLNYKEDLYLISLKKGFNWKAKWKKDFSEFESLLVFWNCFDKLKYIKEFIKERKFENAMTQSQDFLYESGESLKMIFKVKRF